MQRLASLESITADGVRVTLRANVDLPEEAVLAASSGADGVGLMRTEFLVLGRATMPDEDEQYRAYKRVVEAFGGKPVVIRTFERDCFWVALRCVVGRFDTHAGDARHAHGGGGGGFLPFPGLATAGLTEPLICVDEMESRSRFPPGGVATFPPRVGGGGEGSTAAVVIVSTPELEPTS